jgi:hypothetical protein
MLALHGFDAYGLEISATAVKEAQHYATSEMKSPQAYNFGEGYQSAGNSTRGAVTFLKGDFFQSDWCTGVEFDMIYDYTVWPESSTWAISCWSR